MLTPTLALTSTQQSMPDVPVDNSEGRTKLDCYSCPEWWVVGLGVATPDLVGAMRNARPNHDYNSQTLQPVILILPVQCALGEPTK